MNKPLIIYHGGCKDGFGAAWVARGVYPDAEFFAASYGKDELPDVTDRRVFILDFSYPRETLEKINKLVTTLRVLDHHATVQKDLEGLPYCTFDMNRSGISMTWDYFHTSAARPWIVNYVEDRDLWRWALPSSREINAYLQTLPYDFEKWDEVYGMRLDEVKKLGKEFMRVVNDRNTNNMGILLMKRRFAGYEDIPVINAPTEGISELMEMILQETGAPFAVGWRVRSDGRLSLSLRSIPEFDCSVIAKQLGGGGHKNAAGAEVHGAAAVFMLDDFLRIAQDGPEIPVPSER